jgi:hypothetical protein
MKDSSDCDFLALELAIDFLFSLDGIWLMNFAWYKQSAVLDYAPLFKTWAGFRDISKLPPSQSTIVTHPFQKATLKLQRCSYFVL